MSKNINLSYTHMGGPIRHQPSYAPVYLFLLADIAMFMAVVLAWPLVHPLFGATVEWAVGQSAHHAAWQDMLNYPYVLLWGMPLGGSIVAWSAMRANSHQLALISAALPVVLFALAICWFDFAPMHLR